MKLGIAMPSLQERAKCSSLVEMAAGSGGGPRAWRPRPSEDHERPCRTIRHRRQPVAVWRVTYPRFWSDCSA
jgi:hypothetical protein